MTKFGVRLKGILRCKNQYLLVKKWVDDRIDEPYQWQFFDTVLEADSNPQDTILGYIHDCTGMYADISSIPYTWTYSLGDNMYLGITFLCNVDDTVVIMSEEISEYKWVRARDISKYIDNKTMLKDMAAAGIFRPKEQNCENTD